MADGDVRGELRALQRKQAAAALVATERAMDLILGAGARIAPHETGQLAASGDTEVIRNADGSFEVVGFFATVYARRQHEELSWVHGPGKQAKFLESPFNQAAPHLDRIVAAAIRSVTPG